MKKFFLIAIAIFLILTGIYSFLSQKQSGQDVINSVPEEDVIETTENDAVIQKVVGSLAKEKGIEASEITVLEYEQRDWPDGCLGIAKEDTMCTMAIVPGYYVKLLAQDTEYSYRTNLEGSLIVLEK